MEMEMAQLQVHEQSLSQAGDCSGDIQSVDSPSV